MLLNQVAIIGKYLILIIRGGSQFYSLKRIINKLTIFKIEVSHQWKKNSSS